jgi:hypothetical protein
MRRAPRMYRRSDHVIGTLLVAILAVVRNENFERVIEVLLGKRAPLGGGALDLASA